MTTEREQLADAIADAIAGTLGEVAGIFDTSIDEDLKMADAILAAGYRKPRTVTTVEELDALPVGSVVLDDSGLSLHRNEFTGWCASNGAKNISNEMFEQEMEAFPMTVLHEGNTNV